MADYYLTTGERVTVDDDLLPQLEGLKFRLEGHTPKRSYWQGGKSRTQTLASFVMDEQLHRGMAWYHRDGDWRNFERTNLYAGPAGAHLAEHRTKAHQEGRDRQGRRNGLGYTGVSGHGRRYRAYTTLQGKGTYLGLHDTAEDAARAVDAALVAAGYEAVNAARLAASRAGGGAGERGEAAGA